jgi:hypothetical protein
VPRILDNGTYKVCVYAADHPPPHCHVYWDGNKSASIDLATVLKIAGDRVPREAISFIRANAGLLLAEWNRLNP